MANVDFLGTILERKRHEVARRERRADVFARLAAQSNENRAPQALAALRRGPGDALRVIAEVKFASPSVGVIRAHEPGAGAWVARRYVEGGAAAVSVLADRPGFGGSPLEVRRVTAAVSAPVLFKEFVLDPVQVELARAVGASMVLLLVRALSPDALVRMIDVVRAHGMEPVVEAADEAELAIALATPATIVGVNARDLRTFRVDPALAARCMSIIPDERIAVFMSGVKSVDDFAAVEATRAHAVLVGEGLMRERDPGVRLAELRASAGARRGAT